MIMTMSLFFSLFAGFHAGSPHVSRNVADGSTIMRGDDVLRQSDSHESGPVAIASQRRKPARANNSGAGEKSRANHGLFRTIVRPAQAT